jgi:hypothetical protein
VLVMLQWAWQWMTFQRGARLITGDIGRLPPVRDVLPDGTIAMDRAAGVVGFDPAPKPRSSDRAIAPGPP